MMQASPDLPVALTIAGSDSGAGAGIQADLLSFAANGVFGTTAVTCLTAQNPRGVSAVQAATPEFVRAQLDQLAAYFDIRALKTGMLYDVGIIRTVCAFLGEHRGIRAVVDPVMVATSGAMLLREDAVAVMRGELLPLATLVTPNLDEAAVLLDGPVKSVAGMRIAAQELGALTHTSVLLKGGHLDSPDTVTDILSTKDGRTLEFSDARVPGVNTHGSGCTLSAAIAAQLALGRSIEDAVAAGRRYLIGGMRHSIGVSCERFIAHLPRA
jgi:hydroxymethylpyrimidine/phosphomethylpyrimidine kinase